MGKPTNPHLLPHVLLRFTNRKIMMMAEWTVRYNAPFEGALMGSSTAQYPPVKLLEQPLPFGFLDLSPRTGHKSRGDYCMALQYPNPFGPQASTQ